MNPLRKKLIRNNITILAFSFVIVGALVFYGLNSLSQNLLGMSRVRALQVQQSFQDTSDQNISKIKSIFTEALQVKGRKMIEKDSSSVQSMMDDNAFLRMRDFLSQNFTQDPEIVAAAFFTYEDGEIKAWQFVDGNYPKGLDIPVIYNIENKSWKSTYKGKRVVYYDPLVLDIVKKNEVEVIRREITLGSKTTVVLDCYVPVFEGMSGSELSEARSDGEAIGYLRYVLSLDKMLKTVLEEEGKNKIKLEKLQNENLKARGDTIKMGKDCLNQIFLVMLCSALALFGISYYFSRFFATKISNPVLELTKVAESMAEGNYKQNVQVTTDDEIGILASTFQTMSNAITKRDEDLAELNKNLENLVEQRTAQLHDEMLKIENLLNNMRQAVFTVDTEMNVISPVSKFAEEIFGMELEGTSVLSSIFKFVPEGSEELAALKTALIAVYGEDDLQWDLMEDNFPTRLEYNVLGNDKILKVSYTPLWNEEQILDKIMFVVDDVTEVEKLEREVAIQKAESAQNIQMIQELASSEIDELKDFFGNSPSYIYNSQKIVEDKVTKEKSVELFRNLHTLKGNARVFGLASLSKLVHEAENEAVKIRDNIDADFSDYLVDLKLRLDNVIKVFFAYSDLAEKIFQIENEVKLKQLSEHFVMYSTFQENFIRIMHHDAKFEIEHLKGDFRILEKQATVLGLDLSLPIYHKLIKECNKVSSIDEFSKASSQCYSSLNNLDRSELSYYLSTSLFSPHSMDFELWVLCFVNTFKLSEISLSNTTLVPESLKDLLGAVWSKCELYKLHFLEKMFAKEMICIDENNDYSKNDLQDFLGVIWTYMATFTSLDFRSNVKMDKLISFVKEVNSDSFTPDKCEFPRTIFLSSLKSLSRSNVSSKKLKETVGKITGINPDDVMNFFIGDISEDVLVPEIFENVSLVKYDELSKSVSSKFSIYRKINFILSLNNKISSFVILKDMLALLDTFNDTEESLKRRNPNQMLEVLDVNFTGLKDAICELEDASLKKVLMQKVGMLLESPFQPSLYKYFPMVRDISQRLGKKARFKISGEEVTFSRDKLYLFHDSFVHILRNSLDHGIEDVSTRRELGKREVGTIEVESIQNEELMKIVIRDDGKGIDVDQIVKSAVDKKIVSCDEVEKFSEQEKLMLIFNSGFSTKEVVTDLSGRGVGMDVVKNNIEKIGGTISIYSEMGKGLELTIVFSKKV